MVDILYSTWFQNVAAITTVLTMFASALFYGFLVEFRNFRIATPQAWTVFAIICLANLILIGYHLGLAWYLGAQSFSPWFRNLPVLYLLMSGTPLCMLAWIPLRQVGRRDDHGSEDQALLEERAPPTHPTK